MANYPIYQSQAYGQSRNCNHQSFGPSIDQLINTSLFNGVDTLLHPGFNSGICQLGGNCMEPCSSNSFGQNEDLELLSRIKEEPMEEEVGKFHIINYRLIFYKFFSSITCIFINLLTSNLQREVDFYYIFIHHFFIICLNSFFSFISTILTL